MRAIYCDRIGTYEALLEKARLPTLYNRRLQDIAIFMYKVKTKLVPSYILTFLVVTRVGIILGMQTISPYQDVTLLHTEDIA